MSEKMRFFRSGLLLTLVGLAMRTVSMFFGAFVSRTVGAEGTGLFTLVMSVYTVAVTFATSSVNPACSASALRYAFSLSLISSTVPNVSSVLYTIFIVSYTPAGTSNVSSCTTAERPSAIFPSSTSLE